MCRGIVKNFKIPLYIGFDQPMTKEILDSVTLRAESAGAEVVSTVSDMATDNQGLWKELGVTPTQPWYTHPADPTRKIFCFADPPHCLKNGRNHLLDTGYYLPDGTKVTKAELQELFFKDQAEFKMKWKLTSAHFDCVGAQRQKVDLAVHQPAS